MSAGYFPWRLISFPGAKSGLALPCQPLTQPAPPPNGKEISCDPNPGTHAHMVGSFILYSLHHSGTCQAPPGAVRILEPQGFLHLSEDSKTLPRTNVLRSSSTKNINRPRSLAQMTAIPRCIYHQRNGPA